MIKMHKESARRAAADPDTEQRLAALRNVFTGITDAAAAVAARQGADAAAAASRARAAQVRALHARAEAATETQRRAPDRAFFVRPQGQLDADLWADVGLRSWYSGGAATGALEGAHFGGPTLGASLREAGYVMDAARALPPPANPYRADAPAPPRPEDALNRDRALAGRTWRAAAAQAHWSDREAVLQVERASARDALAATGYSPQLLQQSQPYKSRPASDDAWRFKPPPPAEHKEAMVTARTEAARPGVLNFAHARVASQRALGTDRSNFF